MWETILQLNLIIDLISLDMLPGRHERRGSCVVRL